jgi:hypothetical protein
VHLHFSFEKFRCTQLAKAICKKAYDFSYAITDPKATDGFEPTIRELQSHALPLG